MGTKMKGLFKGMKYISQIFVYKEHEMEIGYPTDVRHVAHIGWDGGGAMNAPSWMNEFKTVSDFSTATVNNFGQSRDPGCVAVARWPVQDYQQTAGLQQAAGIVLDSHSTEPPGNPKKPKRKKPKNPSSPSKAKRSGSSLSSSSRYSRSKSSQTVHGETKSTV